MVLKDFDTSYRYNVFIKNGTLATLAMCSSIRVDSIPDKRYIEGDTLDLTGAVVVAVCEDGSERQVLDFTYPEAVLTESSQVEISYVEFGSVFTVTVDIPIISLIGIRVDSIPDVEYIPGAILDLSDAIVYATFSDGTEKQITDFTYPDTVPNNYQVEIIYSTWGSTVSTIVYLPVNNIEDFNYTENEDGTKTLTGWKGTFLGESSTEIIIPDDESVIV